MGYTALYREWRPRTFKEVVGQKHITVTLKNQVIEKRIAHAYLFVEQGVLEKHLQLKYYQRQ